MTKPSSSNPTSHQLSLLEQIIQEEIEAAVRCEQDTSAVLSIVNEGFADVIKQAWEKTKGTATSAWEGIKNKFSQSTSMAKSVVAKKIAELKAAFPQIKADFDQLREVEAQSGEKLGTNPAIMQAMKLPNLVKAATAEIQAAQGATKQVAQQQPQQAPTQPLQAAQEAYMAGAADILSETIRTLELHEITSGLQANKGKLNEAQKKQLNELGVIGVAGLALGALGGIPLILKGLHKLASFLGMEKTAHAFETAHHTMHHVEETAIDYMVPDKLSFAYYQRMQKVFSKNEQPIAFEEYRTSDVRKKVEGRIYKIILVFFLFHGVHSALEAGASLIGAAEGAASTIKAIEIGSGVIEATSEFTSGS
jgi:hypothetical protein